MIVETLVNVTEDKMCIRDSYENFLNFHRTYYHPSNSYIYLYGNMDMEEKLAFLDEHRCV